MSDRSTLVIDDLNLRLPSGFGQRANGIARETARQLSRMPLAHDVSLNSLTVPPVRVAGGETNGVIARRIAQAIHTQVSRRAKGEQP